LFNPSSVFFRRKDLMRLHDDTLEKTREWFGGMDDDMKRRFENHYGDMPHVETDYWDLPNGPAWHWWTIAILPLDPQAQVSCSALLRAPIQRSRVTTPAL
jgi:hypothetical protein